MGRRTVWIALARAWPSALLIAGTLTIAMAPEGASAQSRLPPPQPSRPAASPPAVQQPAGTQPPAATQPAANQTAASEPAANQAADDSVGSVATVQAPATDTRKDTTSALKVGDSIFKGDVLQTGQGGALGITFDDESTFKLSANARIVVDELVYSEGGKNSAVFNVSRGVVAFVAGKAAKTGDMKIVTPTATLGVRGTTGVIEVPEGATPGTTGDAVIKLYPDADGRVGRIEVFALDGARLGFLTRGSTAFAIRPGAGGRFSAVALQIPPQQIARDRALVRQAFTAHNVGRQMVIQRRSLRPGGPQRPGLQQRGPGQQPGLQRGPGQQRPGLQRGPGQDRGLQRGPGQERGPGGLQRPSQDRGDLQRGPGQERGGGLDRGRGQRGPGFQRGPGLQPQRQPGLQRLPGLQQLPGLQRRPGQRGQPVPPGGRRAPPGPNDATPR